MFHIPLLFAYTAALLTQTNLDNIAEAPPTPPLSLHKYTRARINNVHTRRSADALRALDCRTRNKRTSGWRERRRETDGCKARPGTGNCIFPNRPAVVFSSPPLTPVLFYFITRFLHFFFPTIFLKPDISPYPS